MRIILFILVLLIVVGIALVGFGVVNLRQDDGKVAVETQDLEVGTTTTNVQLPVVRMEDRQVEVPSVAVENEAANGQ